MVKLDIISKVWLWVLILISNISAAMLWLTKETTLRSQSMYFDQPNVIYYIGMHLGIILAFLLLNATVSGRVGYFLTAMASIFTLMFDLGTSVMAHNIATALLFSTACYSVIKYGKLKYRTIYIILCSIGGAAFLTGILGYLGSSGIFLGEVIAEICISAGILIEITNLNKE